MAALVLPVAAPAQARPADPSPPAGWAITGAGLTWTAPAPVPPGGAAVEFWEGDRLLGVPGTSADLRTYTLPGAGFDDVDELQVRVSGRRLDAEEPAPASTASIGEPPALSPAGEVDPGKPGPFATRTGEYELDPITAPGYAVPLEMRAVVVAPTGAPGRRPLALFLHGRHVTCYNETQVLLEWPCPAPAKPVPSHRGYLQAQRLLASQGYVTVSVSANSVNAQDTLDVESGAGARSALVRAHLARWADWAGAGRAAAPEVVRAAPVADLGAVFLVGHSRGGEGVNRAAVDSVSPPPQGDPVRWTVKGTLLIGPTIFGHNPAPDVPSATILPGCDGDVSDLQGQLSVDGTRGVSRGAALHSALYVVGANHNFFNTEWTPGQAEAPANDDFPVTWTDAVCSPGTPTRLTAEQQQNAGATYIAAAARLFVAGDRRVLPLLDGSGVRAPSADPARVLAHAVGGARSPFVVPDETTSASGSARVCAQVSADAAAACVDPAAARPSPHFVRFNRVVPESGRFAVALRWTADGQSSTVRPGAPVSLAGSRHLALRLAVPPNTTANRFDVAVTDAAGRRAQLGTVALDGLPATERLSARWAQEVRVPLPARGIDLRRVAELELVPHGDSGEAWLIDAHGWAPGLPDPRPVALPRVDVGALTVEEGDSGTRTVHFPVSVTGDGAGSVRVLVQGEDGAYTEQLVAIEPGQHEVAIPVQVTGNTRWSFGAKRVVLAKAVKGAVVGRYTDRLTVPNDDPEPTVTATPVVGEVTEGGTLTWRVTLSSVADSNVTVAGRPIAPDGVELSTTDVDEVWFRQRVSREEPLPSRPLSSTGLGVTAYFQRGQVSVDVSVLTVADAEVEPTERIRFDLATRTPGSIGTTVFGTVTDGPVG
ncbi:hypothetical protein [Saccharothrix texasensis]|uniref:hypothetical protein n=1 Tax=Saccharothrix texasensis TaxID=103734 RepID=UPI001FEB7E67|nr:hypothetical protein [Saccharothrix texasensis]